MIKGLLTIIGTCLCLILGLHTSMLYAASQGNPGNMQDHIEKVKRKNPAGYQEMLDKSGGNITNCLSCHLEINKKNNASSQTNPR